MSETSDQILSGVAETLLIPLYARALESQRPDAILKDEKAVAIVAQLGYDFDQVRKIRMNEGNKVARIMLTREMDRYARDFLSRYPELVVVHSGMHLLDEWGFFDQPEPRMDSYRWIAPFFRLFKPMRIFHYQIGKVA